MTDTIKSKINKFVIKQMLKHNTPGISVGILKDGEIFHARGYGYRNIAHELPMTADTLYGIGSTSKCFTALAIMQLVEQGKVDLQTPISNYLNFELGFEENPILIHHLLSHSSGVQDFQFASMPYVWSIKDYTQLYPMTCYADFLDLLNSVKDYVRFPPGEIFMYSNDLYEVLGILIAKVTGVDDYKDYILTNVIKPIGMERSTFFKADFFNDPLKDYMTGYGFNPITKSFGEKPFPWGKTVGSAAGLMSSAREMLIFAKTMLNKGEINGQKISSPLEKNLFHGEKPLVPPQD